MNLMAVNEKIVVFTMGLISGGEFLSQHSKTHYPIQHQCGWAMSSVQPVQMI